MTDLPTPSAIIDRAKFAHNCQAMLNTANSLDASFRAHIKTHKTKEGVALQMGVGDHRTDRIVVLTLLEAWSMMPLVEDGVVSDILFGLPIVRSKIAEAAHLATLIPHMRLMIDNLDQLQELVQFSRAESFQKKWLVFIKVNQGSARAGLENGLEGLKALLDYALTTPEVVSHVDVYGFYCHAGQLYGARSLQESKDQLVAEIAAANEGAAAALKLVPSLDLVISVGATPTAHAAGSITTSFLESQFGGKLHGALELHAGNYPCCDLQQCATGCVTTTDVSFKVVAEVASHYPGRGSKGPGEMLINAGVLALSREVGATPGFGKVMNEGFGEWLVGRLSQEHGILVATDDNARFLPVGNKVVIIPQHACITAAQFPWFFVIEKDVVVDVWVPCRGW